ncbi:MAG: hypothetical protein H6832_08680 [Planctomycetes bacterium]|nr:hypothetical protein [Planctomycetota bacterium]MCB9918465.1 hypothetical protein [Planctomycetota bacterium]
MNAKHLRALALSAVGALAACSSQDAARYDTGPESYDEIARPAPRDEPSPSPARRTDEFGTYSDDAAARLLDEKVAAELARQIEERDREARQREADIEIARAYAEAARTSSVRYYGSGYYDSGYYDSRYYGPRRYRNPVPWNTLFYGGLGAIIGHQYGHRDRGLAIGAGFGLLQDALRWRW